MNELNIDAMTKEEIVSLFSLEIEKQNQAFQIELDKQIQQIHVLTEALKDLHHRLYGSKSEKTKALANQLSLFDEVEATPVDEPQEEEEVEETVTVVKRKSGRKTASQANPELEVVEIFHDNDELLQEGYENIGYKERETLHYKPAELWIERHFYPVYEKENEFCNSEFQTEYQGNEFLARSFASPEIVASIINDKYAKGLPLYRIESVFKDLHAVISRQTMCNWLKAVTELYLKPMENLMIRQLLTSDVIHADETTVQVLHHQDGSTNKKSYMWVYRSSVHDDRIIIYDYRPGRGKKDADAYLLDYKGYVHSDGYAVYQQYPDITQVGCVAHARRKIKEALQVVDKKSDSARIGKDLLFKMNRIFTEDKKLQTLSIEDRYYQRLEKLKPLFDDLKASLESAQGKILANSKLGSAISYNLNQFESFENVLLDGRLELTNNCAERALKNFVIGRKSWLFMNTTNGAKTSSTLYSIVQSAKENNLRVEAYLTYVFNQLSSISKNEWTDEILSDLLPHSKNLPMELYTNKKSS